MSAASQNADDRALLAGWVEFGDGVNATRSPEIIQQTLQMIRNQHILCTVVAKGYESGKVALLGFGRGKMVLDKPVDWPPRMKVQPLRVLFKDRGELWNQFAVKLLGVTGDSLITSMPLKYVRLQRRSNYRVGVPRGSEVVFQCRGEMVTGFQVENISANGSLIAIRSGGESLSLGELITNVVMSFPTDNDETFTVEIGQGRVVRSVVNEQRESCFGVQFLVKPKEEKMLLQYVRLREREMLRRGMGE
mgnify:CR=1 FL=1